MLNTLDDILAGRTVGRVLGPADEGTHLAFVEAKTPDQHPRPGGHVVGWAGRAESPTGSRCSRSGVHDARRVVVFDLACPSDPDETPREQPTREPRPRHLTASPPKLAIPSARPGAQPARG